MSNRRGFTLIELMMSLTIMVVAVAATCAVLIEAMHLTRNSEEIVQSDDAARVALEFVAHGARVAGMGSPGGIYLNNGGVPIRINAVFGTDSGAGGTDDLWIVVPDSKALRPGCLDSGAEVPLTQGGFGPLKVPPCFPVSASGFTPGQLLLVSNSKTSALISGTSMPDNITINYLEQGAPFSNRVSQGQGYQPSDMVFPVSIFHFFIAAHPQTGHPSLFRCNGTVATTGSAPFVDTANCMILQSEIEDFQVAYGIDTALAGNPDSYAYQNGLSATPFNAGLRSLRVTVVATGRRKMLDANGRALATASYAPFTPVENHTIASPTPDGFRRNLYSRRVELPNLAPTSL